MKVDRIEALLRSGPSDEPAYRGELLLGPRIVPTTRPDVRARRPAAAALAGALVVGHDAWISLRDRGVSFDRLEVRAGRSLSL